MIRWSGRRRRRYERQGIAMSVLILLYFVVVVVVVIGTTASNNDSSSTKKSSTTTRASTTKTMMIAEDTAGRFDDDDDDENGEEEGMRKERDEEEKKKVESSSSFSWKQQEQKQKKLSKKKKKKYTIDDMICEYIEQPLNHFALPRDSSPTYMERYCRYDEFVTGSNSSSTNNATIFLYVGNESPIESYINHTGLMWEYGEQYHAQIIFIEHRYEGFSIPSPNISNCMSYSSSIQAIADYARFIELVLFDGDDGGDGNNNDANNINTRPVIAFGGSYGGMLASWIRMKYPNMVMGAIAASAPIWGFPRNFPNKIDTAWQVIKHALQQPYPPTTSTTKTETTSSSRSSSSTTTTSITDTQPETTTVLNNSIRATHTDEEHKNMTASTTISRSTNNNYCWSNLLASWPLMNVLGRTSIGREILHESFHLCDGTLETQDDVTEYLIPWAQSPWFDYAEGSYPYESNYIPFSLTHNESVVLPAWPLHASCWTESNLHDDHGVHFYGNLTDVTFNVSYDEYGIMLNVNWDNVTLLMLSNNNNDDNDQQQHQQQHNYDDAVPTLLLGSVRDAVSVWYNMTKDVQCYNPKDVAPNNNNNNNNNQKNNNNNNNKRNSDMMNNNKNNNNKDGLLLDYSSTSSYTISSSSSSRRHLRSLYHHYHHPGRQRKQQQQKQPPSSSLSLSSSSSIMMMMNNKNSTELCQEKMAEGSWPSLCCNEEMNLIIYQAEGLGNDYLWPPSHPRGTSTYGDIIHHYNNNNNDNNNTHDDNVNDNDDDGVCSDPTGSYGYPKSKPDPWSTWYDIYYGGIHDMSSHSNIIFSNGMLDPWSAAGVYATGMDPWIIQQQQQQLQEGNPPSSLMSTFHWDDGIQVQNITNDGSVIAILMEYGGHHTDLMYGEPDQDPIGIVRCREIEMDYIQRWIDEFWKNKKEYN